MVPGKLAALGDLDRVELWRVFQNPEELSFFRGSLKTKLDVFEGGESASMVVALRDGENM